MKDLLGPLEWMASVAAGFLLSLGGETGAIIGVTVLVLWIACSFIVGDSFKPLEFAATATVTYLLSQFAQTASTPVQAWGLVVFFAVGLVVFVVLFGVRVAEDRAKARRIAALRPGAPPDPPYNPGAELALLLSLVATGISATVLVFGISEADGDPEDLPFILMGALLTASSIVWLAAAVYGRNKDAP
jgi:hypothetical protein